MSNNKKGYFNKYEYPYDEFYDCYICPNNEILKYNTTNREGYKEYKSNPSKCKKGNKELYNQRSQTIECILSDARELHGMSYAKYISLSKMKIELNLLFVCMNF